MKTIPEEKQRLRRILRRMELPAAYRQESSRRIAARLLALDAYRNAGTVCCFVGTAREIDTRPILEDALLSGKRLCVPLCTSPGQMEMRAIAALDCLAPGTMGILEPPPDTPVTDAAEIDLAVLPCVSCDKQGRRLGYGGGYYDRFLRHYTGAAVLLCRERLLRTDIPVEAHDIPIPHVLTEEGVYAYGVLQP